MKKLKVRKNITKINKGGKNGKTKDKRDIYKAV